MSTQEPQKPTAWPLDYAWAQRQGHWSPLTDVLLEGHLEPSEALRAAYTAMCAGCLYEASVVDQKSQEGYWHGGVFSYLRPSSISGKRSSIWLHARGEDAFDSLHETSRIFAQHLENMSCKGSLVWIEHPHQRDYQQRSLEPTLSI